MNQGLPDQWSVAYTEAAVKTLRKLDKRDRPTALMIRNALLAVAKTGDPRSRGKGLTGNRAGQWRYRVGDWRVIVDIQDNCLVLLAVEIGHRSRVY